MPLSAPEQLSLVEVPKFLPKPQIVFVAVIFFCALVGSFGLGNMMARRKLEKEMTTKLGEKDTRVEFLEKTNQEFSLANTGMQHKVKEMENRIGFLGTYLNYQLAKERFWVAADEICGAKHKVFPSALVPLDSKEMKARKAALEELGEYLEKLRLYGKDVDIKNLIVTPQTAGEAATIQFAADPSNTVWVLPGELQRQQAK